MLEILWGMLAEAVWTQIAMVYWGPWDRRLRKETEGLRKDCGIELEKGVN